MDAPKPTPRRGGPARGQRRRRRDAPPTVRQVYALAAALCAFTGIDFPKTRVEASELIEGLRIETKHPQPSLK